MWFHTYIHIYTDYLGSSLYFCICSRKLALLRHFLDYSRNHGAKTICDRCVIFRMQSARSRIMCAIYSYAGSIKHSWIYTRIYTRSTRSDLYEDPLTSDHKIDKQILECSRYHPMIDSHQTISLQNLFRILIKYNMFICGSRKLSYLQQIKFKYSCAK